MDKINNRVRIAVDKEKRARIWLGKKALQNKLMIQVFNLHYCPHNILIKMNEIDVNYIVEGKVEVFDWLFIKRVGIDADKNYIYLVEDKFRDRRYAKFVAVPDPHRIKEYITQLLIFQNSNDSRLIQPIFDFTVSKQKRLVLVTMPVPPRTLYSVIKDTKVDLKMRLFLVQNLAGGGAYMHNRRRSIFGQIRPESIVIHQELNAFEKGNLAKKTFSESSADLYARLSSFSTLVQSQAKAENWKWDISELQYYDAPEIWAEIDKKKKGEMVGQSEKLMDTKPHMNRYTNKSDVWALGLVFVEILTAMRVSQLLEGVVPGKMLKDLTKQKGLKLKSKMSGITNEMEKIDEKQLAVQKFYGRLLNFIECFTLKTLVEKMLSYRPEKRPTITEVLQIVQRLETVDKKNRNIRKVSAYKKSLRNLKECQQIMVTSNKQQQGLDDNKSIVSMKSVRSGKSDKSHLSLSRKRVFQTFSTLLYARQTITELHSTPSNSLYRTYVEDCKNRLPSDINFTLPLKKLLIRKQDKAMVLSMCGEEEEDIKDWNLQKIMNQKIPSSYQQRILDKISGQGDVEEEFKMNLGKGKGNPGISYGPAVKRIAGSAGLLKQEAYNQNLENYHYIGVANLKKQQQLLTCLNRKQVSGQFPEKQVQFILNLKYRNLLGVPACLNEYLGPSNCLKYLSLSHNKIATLLHLTINPLLKQNLLVLDVSHNCLRTIDGLWMFAKLTQAYFIDNLIDNMSGFSEPEPANRANQTASNFLILQGHDSKDAEVGVGIAQDTLQQERKKLSRRTENLRKIYMNKNRIRIINGILELPLLEVLSVGQNPLLGNAANSSAIQVLRAKGVKVYY